MEEQVSAPESESESQPQSEITGKKVFFLYPTGSIRNQVINELIQNEYEVYIAKDHGRLPRVLKKFPGSIVFINIEEKISKQEWERWIGTTLTTAPDTMFGVFSSNTDEEFREKFIKNNHIKCGFLPLKVDMSKATEVILEMFKVMSIKGRRKYLRATIDRETNAIINIPHNSEFLKGVIKDISVVGASCVFEHDPNLSKNSLVKDIQIKLQSMLIKVEAVVFGSREDCGDKLYVIIFTQKVDPEVRVKIRKYIQQNLQNKMDFEIN